MRQYWRLASFHRQNSLLAALFALTLICACPAAFAANPVAVSLTPLSAGLPTGQPTTFTATFSDADGAANIAGVFLLINTSVSGADGIYLYYDIKRDRLFLRNDNNTAWLGGYARGAQMIVQNSYCTLYCRDTTATSQSDTVTVNWRLEFKHVMSGRKCGGWLYAADQEAHSSGWARRGTYLFGRAPMNLSLTPPTGPIVPEAYTTFTATYADPDGATTMTGCWLLISDQLSGVSAIYLLYTPQDNRIYLRNDANTAWLGGVLPGQALYIDNSQARVDVASTSAVRSGGTVTVSWRIFIKSSLTGASTGAWLYSADNSGLIDGWDRFASYSISRPPSNVLLSPDSGALDAGSKLTITSRYQDPDGADNLWACYLLLGSTGNSSDVLYMYYDANTNKLYLRSADDTAWLGGATPGSGSSIGNGVCTLYPAESSVTKSGNALTVNWGILLNPSLSGQAVAGMLFATDDTRLSSGWSTLGNLIIGQPVQVGSVTMAPENLVLNTGDTYLLRAGLMDVYGQVVSSHTAPSWTTSNASRASVMGKGADGLGRFQTAEVEAKAAGALTITASDSGASAAANVAVMDLSSRGKLVENAAWFPDQTLSRDYYLDYYFYVTPGTIYRAYLQTSQGTVDAALSNDPTFASTLSNVRVGAGQTQTWGFTAGSGYGTYFVRVTGRSSSNKFDLWLHSEQNDFIFPVPGSYLELEPNGSSVFRKVGEDEASLYRFEGVSGQQYDLRVDANADVTIRSQQNQVVAHRVVTAGSDNHVTFTSSQSQSYFVTIVHSGDSQIGEAVRLMQPNRTDIRNTLMTLAPARSGLLPGESETVRLALVDSTWLASPEPAFVDWSTGGAGFAFTPGGALGGFVTATATASAGVATRSFGEILARHTSRRAQSYALVDLLGQGEAERLNLNSPVSANVASGGEKGYILALTPGLRYTVTASAVAGEADVELAFDPNFWNNLGFSHVSSSAPYTYSLIAPARIGTVYIRITGTQAANVISVYASSQSDSYAWAVPGTLNRITLNGASFAGKLGQYDLGRGLDDETAWFYIDIPPGRISYSLQLRSDNGTIDWDVADNFGFQTKLSTNRTFEGTTGAYTFIPPQTPARYYIRVRGRSLINRFVMSFSN